MVIYKTTNLINGKYYIGKDSKNYPGYLGSGIAIKEAIKKYGKENFKKEILYKCKSLEELNQKEKEFITEEVINDLLSYNMVKGGVGGSERGRKNPNKGKTWEEKLGKERAINRKKYQRERFIGEKNPMHKKGFLISGEKNGMKGRKSPNRNKHLSEETKNKICINFKNKTWEEIFGIENAIKRRQNSKNKKRSYYIEMIYLDGTVIKLSTIKEAIEKFNLSSRKAYKNNYKEFKFIKINGSL